MLNNLQIKVENHLLTNLQKEEVFIPVFEKEIDSLDVIKKIIQIESIDLSDRVIKFGFIGEINQFFSYKNYHFVGVGKKSEFTKNKLLDVLSKIFIKSKNEKYLDMAIYLPSNISKYFKNDFDLGRVVAESYFSSQYSFDKYKTEKTKKAISNVKLILEEKFDEKEYSRAFNYSRAVSTGEYLTRDLVNEPASEVHPETMELAAKKIVKESKGLFDLEVLDENKCRSLGMNAYLAVAQGSERKPKFIVLKYLPNKKDEKNLVLIGKTVTFDSGGLSLKPSESMEDMKIDMAGGAIVLGFFETLRLLPIKINKNIIGILPACENMPSGKAIKPGDIVKALNGKTIEILNTDAEGRLTLADALAYSEKYLNPDIVIDIATLTGSVMGALGHDIAGLFGNNKDLNKVFKEAADEENEDVWELPLYEKYQENNKSNIADVRNTSSVKYGGAITASLFLKNFITDKIKWIHLDVAGVVYKKTATGWGVKTVINLLNKIV